MASVAISIDDGNQPPQIDTEDKRSRAARWIDKWTDRHIFLLDIIGGNGRPTTKWGTAWKYFCWTMFFLCGPCWGVRNILIPCKDYEPCEGANIDIMSRVGWPVAYFFGAIACITQGVRQNHPEKVKLIESKTIVVNRGTFARLARAVAAGVALGTPLTMMWGALPFSKSYGKIAEYHESDSGKRIAATLLQFVFAFGNGVFLASFFGGIGHAIKWLGVTRKVITRFADEVLAVASKVVGELEACPDAVEVVQVGAGAGSSTAISMSAVEVGTTNPKQIEAQKKIKQSFESAWRMVQATNHIFAMPLSYIFVMTLGAAAYFWYGALVENELKLIFWCVLMTLIPIALLLWVGSLGDAYLNARATLLRPDTSMNLLKVLGRDQAAVFAVSLQRTQLGFDLVNITVTSNRVLYARPKNYCRAYIFFFRWPQWVSFFAHL